MLLAAVEHTQALSLGKVLRRLRLEGAPGRQAGDARREFEGSASNTGTLVTRAPHTKAASKHTATATPQLRVAAKSYCDDMLRHGDRWWDCLPECFA